MKVYQLIASSSEGTINTVGISTSKRDILTEYSDLVRVYVADNLELNEADSSPVDPSMSYEDLLELPLSEIEALVDTVGKENDLTSFSWSEVELELTQELSARVIKYAESKLVDRWKTRALISEVDFLVGVMTAMSALHQVEGENEVMWPDAPPGWVFGALGNRSIVARIIRDQGHSELAKKAEGLETKFTQRYRHLNELVVFLYTVMHNTRQAMGYHEMQEGNELIREHAVRLLDDIGEEWRPNEEA